MSTTPPTPTVRLRQWNETVGTTVTRLREEAIAAGPLDRTTCELIAIAGLAILGYESSFKTHAQRLIKAGVDKAVLQHAVGVTIAASTVLFQVAEALRWIDEAYADAGLA